MKWNQSEAFVTNLNIILKVHETKNFMRIEMKKKTLFHSTGIIFLLKKPQSSHNDCL